MGERHVPHRSLSRRPTDWSHEKPFSALPAARGPKRLVPARSEPRSGLSDHVHSASGVGNAREGPEGASLPHNVRRGKPVARGYVITESYNVWRLNLNSASAEDVDPREFCFERGILGVGWPLEESAGELEGEHGWESYRRRAKEYYEDGRGTAVGGPRFVACTTRWKSATWCGPGTEASTTLPGLRDPGAAATPRSITGRT